MKQSDCRRELRRVDLRATPARIAVMKLLEKEKQPIDISTVVDCVNKEGIKTDPATIFRIMNMLTKRGITIPIQFQEGKMRYELAGKAHHHHLVCEACGKIEDISSKVVPALEKEIQSNQKFLVKRHSLEFFGLCHNCQK
jgi:Fur family transcriptional regulator, ferric uptake regulator